MYFAIITFCHIFLGSFFYKYMVVFLFNTTIYVFLLEEAMYCNCCLCIVIDVYLFLLLSMYSYCYLCILIDVYLFLLLSMYSYCCLCILIDVYLFLLLSMYSY